MTTARKDAQLAALGESVTYYQVEVHRHQQQLETQLQADEDSRALPLYPRFLFKQEQQQQQQQPESSVDHQKLPSSSTHSSSPSSSKHASAMVVRAADDDADPHHWKSPSTSAFADETKTTDVPPPPLPPPLVLAGSSATTRSLFDDLVATRRQLDDLSRLSSTQSPGTQPHTHSLTHTHTHTHTHQPFVYHTPLYLILMHHPVDSYPFTGHHHSDVHLSSTIKQTRDNGRTAAASLPVGSSLLRSTATDISTLTAIARGDFFHNRSVGIYLHPYWSLLTRHQR